LPSLEKKLKDKGVGVSISKSEEKGLKVSLIGGALQSLMDDFDEFKGLLLEAKTKRSNDDPLGPEEMQEEGVTVTHADQIQSILKIYRIFLHYWQTPQETILKFQENFRKKNPEYSDFDFTKTINREETVDALNEYMLGFDSKGFYPHFLGVHGWQQNQIYDVKDFSSQSIESMNSQVKFLIERSNKTRKESDYIQQFLYTFHVKQNHFFNGFPNLSFQLQITQEDVHYL